MAGLATLSQQKFRNSIRFKLLLVSLTLMVIPWAGYRYIQETETFLRQTQENTLLGTAQAVATILHNRGEMFSSSATPVSPGDFQNYVYVQALDRDIQIDGYIEDWQAYLQNMRRYPTQGEVHFKNLVAEHQGYLYLLFEVNDNRIVYQRPGDNSIGQSDTIELAIEQPNGEVSRYQMATTSPGWVSAERTKSDTKETLGRETRIQGEWQESESGYTVEIRIPRYLIGDHLAFRVIDVDDLITRRIEHATSSTGEPKLETLGLMIKPNPDIARIISGLEHRDARIWVLDKNRQVLARKGQLKPIDPVAPSSEDSSSPLLLQLLFQLVLDQPTDNFEDSLQNSAQLNGIELESALRGNAMTHRRTTSDGEAVILSAAWPINSKNGTLGVVLVEQSTNQILSLQNRALERLFGISLIFFIATGLVLLGFATLLVRRIRKLSSQVEQAVTADGQIKAELVQPKSADEIGDLGRSFSGVLNRLAEYNRYLEAMASRLAHELRTPLAVVQSSLENLESDLPAEDRTRYLERAKTGSQRLGLILHRMREATRLEQTLQESHPEIFDLSHLLKVSTESYQTAFPTALFTLSLPDSEIQMRGTPDLISQAIDKLIGNAVDFHTPKTCIEIKLEDNTETLDLRVANQGPLLPEEMQNRLFDSMISIRAKKGPEPHLGLGLYLVRLICEFHRGHCEAKNLQNPSGVEFTLHFPKK